MKPILLTIKSGIQYSVLLLLLVLPALLFAQLDRTKHALSIKANYGLDVSAESANHSKNYLYGLHISYDKNIASSSDEWVRFFNAKNLSFGLTWNNLDHMMEIVDGKAYPAGQALGALAEVDFQLFKIGNAKILLTPGIGLSYLTQNVFTQPETSTIGSHINLTLTGELSAEIPISQNTSLVAGANILHYSNGAVVVPNGGINAMTGSVGVKTALSKPTDLTSAPETYHHIEGNNAEVWIGAGVRGKYRDKRKKFYRSGVYAGYNFYINRALSLKSGTHMVYYHSVFDIDRFDETFQYYGSSYDHIRLGIAAGADFTMGRLVVNAMYGKYLHYNSYHDIGWYWVLGLRYFFTPNIGVQSTLNLHGVQADYVNWGLIFRI
ncbi:acyloxyacyl hydrolase [Parapedobacter tibetensis]|uniref:acyloxyacyl hydrolase n=1 Tax=Parapedobacter tibetensis TaxID=2972951 RepID=UPI00214D9F2D|nr:acyloxyacyl hydrolase [Parapedobacter tibetensis]